MELSDLLTATPHDRLVYAVEAMLSGEFGEPIGLALRSSKEVCRYCFEGILCEIWHGATALGHWVGRMFCAPYGGLPRSTASKQVIGWFGLDQRLEWADLHDKAFDRMSDPTWHRVLSKLSYFDPALDRALKVALARREQVVG